jgi:hypothetical protein
MYIVQSISDHGNPVNIWLMKRMFEFPAKTFKTLERFKKVLFFTGNQKGVSIVTGYGLDTPGSIPGNARLFSSSQCTDQLWDPPSLLSNGY